MTSMRRIAVTLVAAASLVGAIALLPQQAEARGRGGFRGGGLHSGFRAGGFGSHGFVRAGGFFAIGPYFAFDYGFGPFWGPYYGPYPYYGSYPYYQDDDGANLNAAGIAGVGAIEMSVKPNQAEVWVDGKYVAQARDLDGGPSYLWLKEGPHRVVVSKGGYASFAKVIDVRRGTLRQVRVELARGESRPPAEPPAEAR